MGILPVLRCLGRRYPTPLLVLSIPDSDNVSFVSIFHISYFRICRLTFAQHDETDPNVSSFRLTLDRSTPYSKTTVCWWMGWCILSR